MNLWNKIVSWGLQRIFRVLLAIAIAIYAIAEKNYAALVISAIFLLQAIFNVSCGGAQACATPHEKSSNKMPNETDDTVEFEEVK